MRARALACPAEGIPVDAAGRIDAHRAVVEGFERLVIAVDDTDDVTKLTSTGEIAQFIAEAVVSLGGCLRLDITRHQLLLREDIPYTSHNSAMAFEAFVPASATAEVKRAAAGIIAARRAPTSDPGLAVARVPEGRGTAADLKRLIAFGYRAKSEFCPISSAYELASSIPWVSLSEHGGDGAGVVGALAGIGLRIGGNDGRFRGKWDLEAIACRGGALAGDGSAGAAASESRLTVGCLRSALERAFRGPCSFVDTDGFPIFDDVPFSPVRAAKPVLLGGALAVVCVREGAFARPCEKVDLGTIGNADAWSQVCDDFEWDNDAGECAGDAASCRNCLHRRWVAEGFLCTVGSDRARGGRRSRHEMIERVR